MKFRKTATLSAKGTFLSLLLTTCAAFTACNDETENLSFANGLKLSFGVNQPDTRAIFTDATLPDASPVGVKLDGYSYTGLTYTGTTTGGKQTWAPNQDVVLTDVTGTLYAYWPYSEAIDMTAIPVDMTAEDQTDWLYATPVEGINEENSSVDVVMNHAAANINVTINKGAYKGAGAISNITIQSDAFATGGTFNAAQAEPAFTAYEGEGEPLSRNVDITTGFATDVMVVPNGTSAAITFSATIDGVQFTATSAAVSLESGNSYQYTLNLSDINTYMNVDGFSVAPWTSVVKDNLTMEIDKYADWVRLTYNVTSISSETKLLGLSDLTQVSEMAVVQNISRATDETFVITPTKTYKFSATGEQTVFIKFSDMTNIPGYAFKDCTKLKGITVPAVVSSIEYTAFEGCSGLENIAVHPDNVTYNSNKNCNAIIETATNKLIQGCKNTTIPDGIKQIESKAFYGNTLLSGILNIPNSVTEIGASAFSGCTNLTEIHLGSKVQTIGNYAFGGCKKVVGILNIPISVTNIGEGAFYGCTGIESIKVDAANITYDSRNNCNAIMKTATNTLIQGCKNTVIPQDCKTIANYAFNGCTGLTGVSIPEGVVTIGTRAFYECTGLTGELIIPEGVTNIGAYAFYQCSKITSVTIPSSVTKLTFSTFFQCSKLNIITSLATTAPTASNDVFKYIKTDGILYVPTNATGYDAWLTILPSGWTIQEIAE